MKNKISILILTIAILIPQVASAAWWNPFSWQVFSRFFASKSEVYKNPNSENVSSTQTTTMQDDEIEKLKAELEELKNEKTNNTLKTSNATQSKKTSPLIVSSTINNKTPLFDDLYSGYVDFYDSILKERSGLDQGSALPSDIAYIKYLNSLLVKIKADLGYLSSVKYWSTRPNGIEKTYSDKFRDLQNEYSVESKRYPIARDQDIKNQAVNKKELEKEYIAKTELERQQYLYDIRIKLKEMAQLIVQIDTIDWPNLISDLNNAKKLDGESLFYTFKYGSNETYWLYYPYTKDKCPYLLSMCNKDIVSGLKAAIENYKAFLGVELEKNNQVLSVTNNTTAPQTVAVPSWKIFEQDDPYGPNQKGAGWRAMKHQYNLLGPSILSTFCDNKWQDIDMQEGCLIAKSAIESIQ